MNTVTLFSGLFVVSFILAWHSMRDYRKKPHHHAHPHHDTHQNDSGTGKKGRILLLKDKTIHYSSESSSSDPV